MHISWYSHDSESLKTDRKLITMAQNREQLQASAGKASTQIKNGKDATDAKAQFVKECRASGSAALAEFADVLEGKK